MDSYESMKDEILRQTSSSFSSHHEWFWNLYIITEKWMIFFRCYKLPWEKAPAKNCWKIVHSDWFFRCTGASFIKFQSKVLDAILQQKMKLFGQNWLKVPISKRLFANVPVVILGERELENEALFNYSFWTKVSPVNEDIVNKLKSKRELETLHSLLINLSCSFYFFVIFRCLWAYSGLSS